MERSTKENKRSQSYALSKEGGKSNLDRSLPQYHSHRLSHIKLSIPAFYLRGYGLRSYHVFEIQVIIQ